MKQRIRREIARLHWLLLLGILAAGDSAWSQSVVTFSGQVSPYGTNYVESGMRFRVVIPTLGIGSPRYDGMVIVPSNLYANLPSNSSLYMAFLRQFSPDDYVVFSLASGAEFGLSSVDLADPMSPSYTQLPISFIGTTASGLLVSQTFITPGNGADHLLNYQFNPDFASGLLSVRIEAARWAMDNLVFTIPEPAAGSLLALGLLSFGFARRRHRP